MAPGFMRGGLSNSSIVKIVSKSSQSNSGIFVILSIVVISLLTETSLVKTYNLTGSAPVSTYLVMVFCIYLRSVLLFGGGQPQK
jgi:uncharacterized membrane protein